MTFSLDRLGIPGSFFCEQDCFKKNCEDKLFGFGTADKHRANSYISFFAQGYVQLNRKTFRSSSWSDTVLHHFQGTHKQVHAFMQSLAAANASAVSAGIDGQSDELLTLPL